MAVNCCCAHNNEEYFSVGSCLLPIPGETTLTIKLSISNIESSPFCCTDQRTVSLISPRVSRTVSLESATSVMQQQNHLLM